MKNSIKQRLKNILNKVYLPFIYKISTFKPIVPGRVIFADSNTDDLPDSMELVYKNYLEKGYDVRLWVKDIRKLSFFGLFKFLTGFMADYATAEYVYICNYFLPVTSCGKRKGTKVIQLWHSCGMLKKFAYDAKEDISSLYHGSVTKNIDLITVSAPCCVPVFQKAFRLGDKEKEIVKATGVSRTDRFFDREFENSCKKELYDGYPEFRNKKLILWAPTFRGNASQARLVGEKGIEELIKKLPDDWAVIIKLHPHMKESLTNCKMPTYRLFACADILITDYSSLCFEYAFYGKPMIIYAPDFKEYTQGRGLYMDISEAGEVVTDPDKLYSACMDAYGRKSEKSRKLAEKYCASCDGHSTERIIKIAGEL